MTTLLWRELTICAEPLVVLHNAGLRLKGLFRPWAGSPDTISANRGEPVADGSNAGA